MPPSATNEPTVDAAIAMPRPRARPSDVCRVVAAAVSAMTRALLRRAVGRRLHPSWPLGFELVVSATRGSWSVMTEIGMVRWRNVSEAMSPLKTDGLVPRFVAVDPGHGTPLYGAWLEPPDAGDSVLLYFHGGGFVFGSLRTHGELVGALARAARAKTLALQYRLAPEHPMPAAVTDAMRAYRHLLAHGIDPKHIALAGDSAGGTLVFNTLLALRAEGAPLPAAAIAISPWVDLACSGDSFESNARYDFLGKAHCLLAARHYLADTSPASPDVSPLCASLAGLPPILIQAGALETLIDQIRAFVLRAREAEVPLSFVEYRDMVHVWHLLRAVTPAGTNAIDEAGAFVREHTA